MNTVQKQTLTGCQSGCLFEWPEHDGVGFSCQRGLCLRALECFGMKWLRGFAPLQEG